ncbi:MAG: fimbrial protein [Kluyvera sp.]|uniref:fimbrial protein n=1 Tax=Kluyvera sp. TaxID=1538228 RepID=UPI003F2D1657
MKKVILASIILSAFTLGAANAASNAQMTVTADVVAATCDVSLSTSAMDLGNYAPKDFTAIATPVAASTKQFTVGVNNCDAPLAAGDTANLVISGQTLGGNPNIFNSTGTNTGIMLNQKGSATYLKNGDKLSVATAATPSASDFNAKVLTLEAGVASTSTTADMGHISAPVLFSFAYN